jgi:hypothetical protein
MQCISEDTKYFVNVVSAVLPVTFEKEGLPTATNIPENFVI